MEIRNTKTFMRVVHRYLGYFMAGIMLVYAISGILLIYRDTNFLKTQKHYDEVIQKNLTEKTLFKELKMRDAKIDKVENGVYYFKDGMYNKFTGRAVYNKSEHPYALSQMTKLHKASSKDTLSPLNAFFGFCLFFFVLSSFWMFAPKSKIFHRGIIYALAGFVMALLLLYV